MANGLTLSCMRQQQVRAGGVTFTVIQHTHTHAQTYTNLHGNKLPPPGIYSSAKIFRKGSMTGCSCGKGDDRAAAPGYGRDSKCRLLNGNIVLLLLVLQGPPSPTTTTQIMTQSHSSPVTTSCYWILSFARTFTLRPLSIDSGGLVQRGGAPDGSLHAGDRK